MNTFSIEVYMQRKKIDIKERLLETARQSFINKGFHETSLRFLANQSGISVGNFYTYFHSKEDLFIQLLTEKQLFRLQTIFQKLEKGKTGWEKLKIYGEEYFAYVQRDPTDLQLGLLWEIQGIDEQKISPETINIRQQLYRDFSLEQILKEGIKDGSIKDTLGKYFIAHFTMTLRIMMNEVIVLKYRKPDFYFSYLDFILNAIKQN